MSKLGKRTDQRMAMLKNQVSELLWYGQIETTVDRAKAVRSLAEKYITIAMRAYQDDVKVTKTVADAKGAKKEEAKPEETKSPKVNKKSEKDSALKSKKAAQTERPQQKAQVTTQPAATQTPVVVPQDGEGDGVQ